MISLIMLAIFIVYYRTIIIQRTDKVITNKMAMQNNHCNDFGIHDLLVTAFSLHLEKITGYYATEIGVHF